MGKDGVSQQTGKRRPTSASPYAENYKVPMDMCQRHLINHRLMVSKLTRRELEDKYINLCDENFSIKKRFQEQEEQIKKLKTKLMRLSSESGKSKSKTDLGSSYSKLQDLEAQRHELHGKLEALRKSQKKESREKREGYKVRAQSARRPDNETLSVTSSNDGNEVHYDEDRDEVSSTEDDCNSVKSEPKASKACHSCESLKAEKMVNETDFVKMKMNIKFLHKEIQNEKEKNALLARQLEEKLSYEIMKRNAVENMEVINLTRQVEDMTKQIQHRQEEEKRGLDVELAKQAELEIQVRKEKDKNEELFEECERLKKNIEKLKENMSEVEIERDLLKRQQENFTKIVDDNKLLRYQLDELRKHNEDLTRQIETLKEEEAVTKSAQKQLLEKLKTMQQDNDTLSVLLEGLRTENETLAEEKTILQQNLKSLEASPVKEAPPSPEPSLSEDNHSSKPSLSIRLSRSQSEEIAAPLFRSCSQKQVRISQILPKVSLLQQHIMEPAVRPSNAALLLSNMYAQDLAKEFRTSHFWAPQVFKPRESTSSASSTSTEKKRISFQADDSPSVAGNSSTAERKTDPSLDDDEIHQSYAEYFGCTPENQQRVRAYSKIADRAPSGHIAIVIQTVQWREATLAKLLAQKVQHFYVEFGFLGEKGHLMETPHSANLLAAGMDTRPPMEYTFDHRIVFDLDERKHQKRRQSLREMLQPGGRDMVRFLVVHEQIEVMNCIEIGFASIRLRQEIQGPKVEDTKLIETPIYDIKMPAEELGTLRILLEGINLLKMKFWS